jgi:hypothetical protein
MPNPNVVQFSATTPSASSLRYQNFYLGVQDQDYGPTNQTGYWNGISVPNGGYVLYFDKPTQGPSIYVTTNESDALSILLMFYNNILEPIGQNDNLYDAINALYGIGSRNDSIIINRNYENIITDNMYLSFDPSFYMCQVFSAGTPNLIKNLSYRLLTGTTNNMFSNSGLISNSNGTIIQLDGISDDFIYFDFGVQTDLRFTGNVTYEFFIKIKDLTGGTPSPLYYKSPKGEGSLSANTSNKLVYSYGDGTNAQTFESTSTLTNNTWYHIVMVRDLTNTNKLYFYLNGVEDSNTTATYSTATASNNSTTFFNNDFPSGTRYTFADLGVLRLYNSALTAAQVSQNFNAQKSRFGL